MKYGHTPTISSIVGRPGELVWDRDGSGNITLEEGKEGI